ncbi:MAG: HEAT repeat domain-containing protein [Ignavibacteriaceae bacterium]
MKSRIILFAVSLFLLLSFQTLPQEIADQNISAKEACIKTLLDGLNSDNRGLQAGCAFMLGELCCDRSVIALLDILHHHPSEELRILAALSLYKIGDSRGIYAIKQAIKFDESNRVSRLCEKFYAAYMKEDSNNQIKVAAK